MKYLPLRFFFSLGESAAMMLFGSLPKVEVGRTKDDDGEKESCAAEGIEEDK